MTSLWYSWKQHFALIIYSRFFQVTDVEWECVGAEVVFAISITVRREIQGN